MLNSGGINGAGSFDSLERVRGRCGVRGRQPAVALELLDFGERLVINALGFFEILQVGTEALLVRLGHGFRHARVAAVVAASEIVTELNSGSAFALEEPVGVGELAYDDFLNSVLRLHAIHELAQESFVLARVLVRL